VILAAVALSFFDAETLRVPRSKRASAALGRDVSLGKNLPRPLPAPAVRIDDVASAA